MDEELENADEQQTIREKRIEQLRPYQYRKGQTGNALGRYMGGISGKERLKRMIAGMNDEEFEEWCEGMNKIDLFKMAEGNPQTDIESGGKRLQVFVPEAVAKTFNIDANTDPETGGSNQE